MKRDSKRSVTSVDQVNKELGGFVSLAVEAKDVERLAQDAEAAQWVVSMFLGKGGAS